MKALIIHAKSFFYKAEFATPVAETCTQMEKGFENAMVFFFSVEELDTNQSLIKAAQEITAIANKNNPEIVILFAFPHLSKKLASAAVAKHALKEIEQTVSFIWNGKVFCVPFGWQIAFNISAHGHANAQSFHSY